jgi:hypothetical protein
MTLSLDAIERVMTVSNTQNFASSLSLSRHLAVLEGLAAV